MVLKFSPEFRRDLRAEKSYYTEHDAAEYAKEITKRILDACSDLKKCPQKGKSAAERFEIDTDMLFLVIERYIVFYRIDGEEIEIIRLFDTRRNILFHMFGIDTNDPESDDYWN